MRETVIQHLNAIFAMHRDLAQALPQDALVQKLPVASNTIGSQFWCIIGTRESFDRALQADAWDGWNCSMSAEDSVNRDLLLEILDRTSGQINETLAKLEWTDYRDGALLDLIEHESQHQGQLIRYVYGLKHEFPKSLADRWAL